MSCNVEYRKWPGDWSWHNSSLRSQHMHAHLCTTHTHFRHSISFTKKVFLWEHRLGWMLLLLYRWTYLNEVATKKCYSQQHLWYQKLSCTLQVAKKLGPGHTIVTCLCDSGQVSDVIALTINTIIFLLCSDTLQDFLIESGWKWKVF